MAGADQVPLQAFQGLTLLHQLTLEAMLSDSCQQLAFRLLNRTVQLCPYDRAFLWDLAGSRPRLLGVSGDAEVHEQAPLARDCQGLVASLDPGRPAGRLAADAFAGQQETWLRLDRSVEGLSVAWLPIPVRGKAAAGLWLERWQARPWSEAEIRILASLGLGYGAAWARFHVRGAWRQRFRTRSLAAVGVIIAVVLGALFWMRAPLRVVAPCTIIARDPQIVTAPLDGIIAEVMVKSGQAVAAGERLAAYDARVIAEEEAVIRQQVEMARARLQRARLHALEDPRERAEIPRLEERLRQEEIRLELAGQRLADVAIRAPAAGVVVMRDDAGDWRGRPVQVGERILRLVDPDRTAVEIWLPEQDRIPLDLDRPVQVILAADPGATLQAGLVSCAEEAALAPSGFLGFRALAEWQVEATRVPLGGSGYAILYGREVRLGYWLMRKPWAWLRWHLGF